MAASLVLFIWSTFLSLILLTSASVMQFSISDVYAELQSWGTIVIGRFNGTDIFHHDLEYSRVKLRALEISLLDSSHKPIISHVFDSNRYQEFRIDTWEGAKYNSLGASGRRLSTISLGDLSGQLHFNVYIFTESGKLTTIAEDYHQDIAATDVLVEVTFDNLTQCGICKEAAFVDLRVQVSTTSDTPTRVTMQDLRDVQLDIIHIPASAFITASNKATLDGVHTEVVPGFPEVEDESDGTDVIIRFPAFSTSATYGLFVKQDRRSPTQVKEDNRRINNSKSHDKQLTIVQDDVLVQMRSASGQQGAHEYSNSILITLICIFNVFLLKFSWSLHPL